MIRTRKMLVLVAIAALTLSSVPNARAQSPASPEDKISRTVCRVVMTAARPSTFDQDLSISGPDIKVLNEQRIDVTSAQILKSDMDV